MVVCSSYEGQPPDNARGFVSWLEALPAGALDGVRYAVFGCGNKDWARTYQAVPKSIDANLLRAGARAIVERGEANARGDFLGDFEDWYAGFWTRVDEEFGVETVAPTAAPLLEVEFVPGVHQPLLRHDSVELGMVVANRELVEMTAPAARSKRHIEIALPHGSSYRTGDYLAVLPLHPPTLARARPCERGLG